MAEKSYSGFEIGASYRVQAVLSGSNADANRLRVGTTSVLNTGDLIDDNPGAVASKSWALTFTATAETLYFGLALVRAAFSADATISGFSIKKIPASRITTAAKGDGSDDNLLTTYTANVQVESDLLTAGMWSMSAGGTATATESPAGTLNLTGDGTNTARGDQSVTTVIGETYVIDYTSSSASNTLKVGTSQGGTQIVNSATVNGTGRASFVATSETTWIRFDRAVASAATVSGISVKEVTNQDNFIVAYVNVPTTISVTQLFFGAFDGTYRFFGGFKTTGQFCGGVGLNSTNVITGDDDLRGKSVVVGMSCNGETVRLFVDDALVYEGAQSGVVPSTVPWRLFAANSSGSGINYSNVAIAEIPVGREFLTLAKYLQIRNALINQ